MKRFLAATALSLATFPAAHAAGLKQTLEEKGNYGTFLQALEASDAGWFLEEGMSYTAFVPTDEAFGKLPEGVLDALLEDENKPKLNAILEGHVIPEATAMAADLSDGQSLDPATGEPLTISIDGDAVTVESIAVVEADIEAENGIAHGIDEVIVPEMVEQAMKFTGDYPTE